ncbi:ABC transporter permease [Clostridium polynesiense]|uniref:ABC transporter permease n=1 Tax=Clostridium polynesiense TaxID=1325933 RepID=UPI0009E52E5B|nr:ABC transporter permease subunit [Clostridium polynesiense]
MISEDNNMPERYKLQQKEELNKLKYLRSNGIKPLKGYEFEGYNFLVNTMKEFIYIFIPLLVVVLVSDMVSGECTPPTLKFLITQPVKRGKVLFAKFITSLIASLFIIFIVQALAFLVVGMIGGFGNPDYPMSYGTKYLLDMTKLDELSRPTLVEIAGTRQMISMSTYVLRMFLLEGLFIFASCAFGFLVSVLFKSSMISMVFSSVTVFGMTILSILGAEFKSLAAVMKNIFFSYGSIPNLMEGKYALMYNDPSLTIERAIIVMAVWGIVSYIISHIYFTKRDILI